VEEVDQTFDEVSCESFIINEEEDDN